MKHFAFACLFAFWLPVAAMSEADGPDYFAVVGVGADDVLNIRSEPSSLADKIGEIPPETNGLANLGCEGGLSLSEWQTATIQERAKAAESRWCRIEYDGTTGWVAGWYLTEGSGPGPAFDCAAAEGSVEQEICGDPWLSELDREITRLFDLAVANAGMTSDQLSTFKAYQRGWIKGRNECWKADDQTGCIANNYALRIGEIRMELAGGTSQDDQGLSVGPIAFACEGLDTHLVFTAINTEPALAAIFVPDYKIALTRTRSASGTLYETAGGDMSFWLKGSEAVLSTPDKPDQSCLKILSN